MATRSNRDVTLTLAIEALGEENVRRLQKSVEDLAREGGSAAPEFSRLAAEIERMGQQGAALASFKTLSEETATLQTRQTAAAAETATLAERLATLRTAVDAARERQAAANKELQEGRLANVQASNAIAELNAEYDDAGKKTEGYRLRMSELVKAQSDARVNMVGLQQAVRDANAEVSRTASEYAKVEKQHNNSARASDTLEKSLRTQKAALSDAAQAAESLGISTENVAQSEAELLVSLQSATAEVNRTAEASRTAAADIAAAFGTVGIRSAQELSASIAGIRASMATLASSGQLTGTQLRQAFAAGEQQIKVLERELRGLNGTLTIADRAALAFKGNLGAITGGNVLANAVTSIAGKIKQLGREFIETTVRTERMRKGLEAVYKDSTLAGAQFDKLREIAMRSGVSIGAVSDAFLRFSASAKAASIPVEVTNDLFESVARAGVTLGLSSEQVTGALEALSQMASKGTVNMEELRLQLGDRLPGALGLVAQGLGVSTSELIKLVEAGRVTARDLFPALSASLKTMAGDTNTLTSTWARLSNVMTTWAQVVGDAGGVTVMKAALQALGAVASGVMVVLHGFTEALSLAGNAIGRFAAGVTTGDMRSAFADFGEDVEKSADRMRTLHKTIDDASNAGQRQAAASVQVRTALASTTSEILANAAAQEQAAGATNATTSSYYKQLVEQEKVQRSAEAAVKVSQKIVKAKEDEGKAMVATAQLSGDAAKMLAAEVAAVNANLAAVESLAKARTAEAAGTAESIRLIKAEAEARKELTKEQADEIEKLQQKLDVQTAEAERAKQTTAELQAQALAARTAADAYADNSSKLFALRGSMESLNASASALRATLKRQEEDMRMLSGSVELGAAGQRAYAKAQEDAAATRAELTRVTAEAARAEALFRDATADTVAAIQRKSEAEAASLQVAISAAKVSESRLTQQAKEYTAAGQIEQATYSEIAARQKRVEILELELRIQQLTLEAKRRELEVQRAAIVGHDDEAKAKREVIDAQLMLLQAQRDLLVLQEDAIAAQREEVTRLSEVNAARQAGITVIDQEAQARDRNAAAIGRETKALIEKAGAEGRDSEGYTTDANNKRIAAGSNMSTRSGIAAYLRSLGISDEKDADRIAREFTDSKGDVIYYDNPGQKKYAGSGSTLSMALLKAAEAYKNQQRTNSAGGDLVEQFTKIAAGAMSSGASGGSTKTVNINLNGRKSAINVASNADAQALTAMLRALESDMNRAGVG